MKQARVAGTSESTSHPILNSATSYLVQSEVDEVASSVTTSVISTSTAEGEVPQQQCVTESQGGGEVGQTVINPSIEVTVATSVSGADSTFGIDGL